jgi:hypothetical protein
LKKKTRKQPELTAAELALDSPSDDSEILGPSKKRIRKAPSRKSTGPSTTTLASRPMDPLPPINPSTVRGKDIKNPIALALMTSSQDRKQEIQANNTYRRTLEETKRQEAKAEETAKRAEAAAALQWEKDKFNRQTLQAEAVERAKFAQQLILSGKTPEEVSQFINIVFPPRPPSPPPTAS